MIGARLLHLACRSCPPSVRGCAAMLVSTVALLGGCRETNDGRPRPVGENSERTSQVVAVPSVGSLGEDDAVVSSADSSTVPLGSQSDAGRPLPTPLRDDRAEQSENLTSRDLQGVTMEAEWQLAPMPGTHPPVESSLEALDALRRATAPKMRLELGTGGRLRWVFLGAGHALAEGTELRARTDRFGHFLVFPEGNRYRHVLPGALRALFLDRRLDVGAVFVPKSTSAAPGRLHGWPTQRQRLSTPLGEVELETTTLKDEQLPGSLLCRLLTELISVDPASVACASEAVPLRAHFTFAGGGSLTFAVTQISKRGELTDDELAAPPSSAQLVTSELPVATPAATLAPLLKRLRHHTPQPLVPEHAATALVVKNHSTILRGLVIDGVQVAWIMPASTLVLRELLPGTYAIGTRDFVGSVLEPLGPTTLPSTVEVGQNPARTASVD